MGLHASTTVPPCGYQYSFNAYTASFRGAQTPKLLLVSVKVKLHVKNFCFEESFRYRLCSVLWMQLEDCYTQRNRVFLLLMALLAFHFRCRCWSFCLTKLLFSFNSHSILSMISASFLTNSPTAPCFYVPLLIHYLVMPPESLLTEAL